MPAVKAVRVTLTAGELAGVEYMAAVTAMMKVYLHVQYDM